MICPCNPESPLALSWLLPSLCTSLFLWLWPLLWDACFLLLVEVHRPASWARCRSTQLLLGARLGPRHWKQGYVDVHTPTTNRSIFKLYRHLCICMCVCVYIYMHMYNIYIYIYIDIHKSIYISIYWSIYISMYIYLHIIYTYIWNLGNAIIYSLLHVFVLNPSDSSSSS